MNTTIMFSSVLFIIIVICDLLQCVEVVPLVDNIPFFEMDGECMDLTNASPGDVELIKNFHLPATKEGKCLLACIFKKINIISPEGLYQHGECVSAVQNALEGFPEALEKATDVLELCSVELADFVDDIHGCEIAATLFTCVVTKFNESLDSDSVEYIDDVLDH